MRKTLPILGMLLCAALPNMISAQEPPPSCDMCPSTYIPLEEFEEFLKIQSVDQQVRSLNIGKTNAQVAIAHRGRLEQPGGVAEHE